MMKKVFIDGKSGTTGLRIYERLKDRDDIEILLLSDEDRRDYEKRREMLNRADIVFLCLPDEESIKAVAMIDNKNTVVIDASTAHRTSDGWTYGFPELSDKNELNIKNSLRIANPGCHASGFIALVKPLIDNGLIEKDIKLTCHSITGYSGGGKKMIEQYESDKENTLLTAPRQYGLTQVHKHLKEMKIVTGLKFEPIFCPIVSDFYSGMVVTVPLFASDLKTGVTVDIIKDTYRELYTGPIVNYSECADEDGMLSAAGLSGKDSMDISVFGNEERILLTARYDNLGKGASGAAIETLNILLGCEKTKGLNL